jgi:hypothetical protein
MALYLDIERAGRASLRWMRSTRLSYVGVALASYSELGGGCDVGGLVDDASIAPALRHGTATVIGGQEPARTRYDAAKRLVRAPRPMPRQRALQLVLCAP